MTRPQSPAVRRIVADFIAQLELLVVERTRERLASAMPKRRPGRPRKVTF